QVEGQAYAAQRGDFARAAQVLRLAAAPAVHEQHAGQRALRREQGRLDRLAAGDLDVETSKLNIHRPRSVRTCTEIPRRPATATPHPPAAAAGRRTRPFRPPASAA